MGVSAFTGRGFGSTPVDAIKPIHVPCLSNLPVIGEMFFQYDPLVYFSFVMFGAVSWFLYCTKTGLTLRAIGESPVTAHAIGFHVIRIRNLEVMFGVAYLLLVYTPPWVENMTAGCVWIALAIPSEVLSALHYLATIIVLVIIPQNRQVMALDFPKSLVQPFRPKG